MKRNKTYLHPPLLSPPSFPILCLPTPPSSYFPRLPFSLLSHFQHFATRRERCSQLLFLLFYFSFLRVYFSLSLSHSEKVLISTPLFFAFFLFHCLSLFFHPVKISEINNRGWRQERLDCFLIVGRKIDRFFLKSGAWEGVEIEIMIMY